MIAAQDLAGIGGLSLEDREGSTPIECAHWRCQLRVHLRRRSEHLSGLGVSYLPPVSRQDAPEQPRRETREIWDDRERLSRHHALIGTLLLGPLRSPCVFRRREGVDVGHWVTRRAAVDAKRAQLQRIRIKHNPPDSGAWLRPEHEAGLDAAGRSAAKRGRELDVSRDSVRLDHQIVAGVVDLRAQDLALHYALPPEAPQ